VLAEVGAYAMVLAARLALGRPHTGFHQQMRAAAGTLRAARREVRALGWAIDRMEARYDELVDGDAAPQALEEALRAEADAIASEAAAAHAAIGRIGARTLPPPAEGPLNLLIHGDMGLLSCGMVGMVTALVQELRDAGREVHAWLTEAAPGREGARVAALQMRHLDVPFTLVPDSAVGWLFDNQRVDALLLRGDRVSAKGDSGVLIGGLGAARLAADAGVPVHVLAPLASIDAAAADGAAIRGLPSLAAAGSAHDVVPAELITYFITEAGALTAPYGPALSRALAAAS
jgi:methylthioribose-1-phosphate isomerase